MTDSGMSDTRRMLAEMVDPLFAELGPGADQERDWARVEELGLPLLLVPEAGGGFGGTWEDALVVFRLAGYHALSLPLPEAILDAIPKDRSEEEKFRHGAFARTAQIAGALDAALERTVEYANERQQFGRPLGKFQAVQQSLATFACEAAAANSAAVGAAQALDRDDAKDAGFEIAAAKLRANRAAGTGTALAHQVHGAIGFTQEYPLHHLTRRMWTWRSEFGNDAYWARELGKSVIARGAENFWPDLTARSI